MEEEDRTEFESALGEAQHEINNPLACVVANLEYALEVLRPTAGEGPLAEVVTALGEAYDAAERIRLAVGKLAAIGRTKT